MGSIDLGALSADLNFLISEKKTELEGVTPTTIQGKKFLTAIGIITDGYEVELNGREVILDTEIILNKSMYQVVPQKGAVLQDSEGTKYKIFESVKEPLGPFLKLQAISQFAKE
jgi:hypothetical protein